MWDAGGGVQAIAVTPRVFPGQILAGAAATSQFSAQSERSGQSEVSCKWVVHRPCWWAAVVFRGIDPVKL